MYGVITAIFLTSKILKASKAADIGVVHFALGCTDLIELKISSSPKTTVADVHPYPTISSLSPG